jgi:hypothetical protein
MNKVPKRAEIIVPTVAIGFQLREIPAPEACIRLFNLQPIGAKELVLICHRYARLSASGILDPGLIEEV